MENVIILGEGNVEQSSALRWLSPILIGLSTPAVLAALFLHNGGTHARWMVFLLLALVLALSIIAYIATILLPGDPVGMRIVKASNAIEIMSAGPLSVSQRTVKFNEVAKLTATVRYDQDGYAENVAELITIDGETIYVPITQSMDEFQFARRAVGLSTRR